jgi:tetratricopeptide (TPR) repeat protein
MLENLNVTNLMVLMFFRGIALAEVGRIEEGITIIENGIDLSERFGVLFFLGPLYNCLGYCFGELHLPGRALELNLKAQEISSDLMKKYPAGVRQFAEAGAQSRVNLMENFFDQGKIDLAWGKMRSLEEEAKSEDFDHLRHQWESRMHYLSAQMLLQQNDLDQAETLIENGIENAREKHMKKREGGFLRLLGELYLSRNEPENAVKNISEGVKTLKEVGNRKQLWQAHASLASAFVELKRFSEAREQWGAAAAVINEVANRLSDRQLKEDFLKAQPIREILSEAES